MAHIFHFEGTTQPGEYIVISEEDEEDAEELFGREGFKLNRTYELEDTGTLPTERELVPA